MSMRMSPERERELIDREVEREVAHALDLLSRDRTYDNLNDAAKTLTRAAWRLEDKDRA